MKRIKILLGISILVLVLGVASLGVMAADKPVVIGLQGPITGAWAYEGEMAKQCCEIAAQLINESGGILGGRMIEVRIADDACEPKAGALAAMKLISQKDVVASVSTYGSSVTEPASNLYEKFKKVNIAYGATNTRLTEKGLKYFFRTCQGIFFADYVTRVFGAKKIAIMHDNTTFAKGVAEETKKALQPKIDAGEVEIVYYDAITPGEKDFSVPLTKLRETHPDVLYFTGYYPEAALVVSQARDIGIDCPFVGGNAAINDEFVKIAGIEKAKGCFMTQEPMPAELPYPESKVFLDAYKAKYGEIPSSPWPVYAADALNIIAYAIDKTGSTDSDVLAEYLRNEVDGVPGVTGGIGFTETGDREGVPYLMYVVNEEGTFAIYNK